MICSKCNTAIILAGSKFCPECGAKIEALPTTPDLKKVFTGVTRIKLGIGSVFNIMPSQTAETTVTIKASEELKKELKFNLDSGTLSIDEPPPDGVNGICISSISGGSISVNRNIVIGHGNQISIGNNNIMIGSGGTDDNVVIVITTPIGTDISIDTAGSISGTIGDLLGKVRIETSGGCCLDIGHITKFNANADGNLTVDIASVKGGNCSVDADGNCNLTINTGKIEKLDVDVDGNCNLNINAYAEKARIDVDGNLHGTLNSDTFHKHVEGWDDLTIIH
jgi:hypothetical protein